MEQRPERIEKKPVDSLQEARRLRRKRRLRNRRIALVVSAVVLVMLIGVGVLLAVLDVKDITVEGETRYSDEEIIEESGLAIGQDLLSVNKQEAHDRLIKAFPYLDTVEIDNASFSKLRITVTEVKVMAAVQVGEEYILMGVNKRALERVSADKVPEGLIRIQGATLNSEKLGEDLLDERSWRICDKLIRSAQQTGLAGMTTIDITQKSNISIWLNQRLQVLFGGENQLESQMIGLTQALPTLYKNEGEEVEGRYDMTNYANLKGGVLTYKSDLEKEQAEKEKAEKEESDKEPSDEERPDTQPEETPEE